MKTGSISLKDRIKKKIPALVVFFILLILFIFIFTRPQEQNFSEKYEGYDLSGASIGRTNTYSLYAERYNNIQNAENDYIIDIFSWTAANGISVIDNFEGEEKILRTEEISFVEYTFLLEKAGMYSFYMEYFPLESRGIDIERSLKINGETPFLGADRLVLYRVWGDAESSRRFDNQGNEIRPAQIEKPRWENSLFTDSQGYFAEPYRFYFKEGINTLSLEGINEPLALRSIILKVPLVNKTYSEYVANLDTNNFLNLQYGY